MGPHRGRRIFIGILLGLAMVWSLAWSSFLLPEELPEGLPRQNAALAQLLPMPAVGGADAEAEGGAATEVIPDTADVTLNNLPLFQVTETEEQSADDRAAIISGRLARRWDEWQAMATPPTFRVSSENPPVISAGDQEILTVTARDVEVSGAASAAELAERWSLLLGDVLQQSRREQSAGYVQRAVGSIVAIVLAAIAGHFLAGVLWRRYLGNLLDRLTFAQSDTDHTHTFSAVNLFLNLTLVLVRGSIWTTALIYSTQFFLVTQRWSSLIRRSLVNSFTAEVLPLGETSFSVMDLLTLLLMLFTVVLVTRSLTNLLRSRVLQVTGINRGVQEAVAVLTRYLLLVIGSILVLQLWGLDLSSLTLLASALGIGVGLGLQNIARDIGSGLVLVFERPIQVGEFIEFDTYMGVVERIGVRSTEIRTLDQVSIIVPNSRFLDSAVTNWSHRNPLSRIHVPVGVAYHSDPEQIRSILLTVARAQPDVLAAPSPQVFFQGFGDNALDFDLLVWTRHPSKQPKLKSDLNFAIAAAFHQHGIEIPFPQRDLHIDGDLPIILDAGTRALLAKFLQKE